MKLSYVLAVLLVCAVLVAGVGYILLHKPMQPSQPGNGQNGELAQPGNGGQPSNGQPSNGTQPSNGGTPTEPVDAVPPSLSVDYRFIVPDKLELTASASDASGVSQVVAEVLGRNYTMPLVGSLYQLNVTDGNLHDVDSIPVRVFAFDAMGNVAVKQLTAMPQLEEKFLSYAVGKGCEESTARQFYLTYESLVKQLYPNNASMLLPCLSLYGSNATLFGDLYRNMSGDQQVADRNAALSEAAKLFVELGYTGKVKVLNPATGSYKEEFLSVPTILALGNYSVAVSQLGLPKHDRQALFLLGNATQINPAIADFEPVMLKDYVGNVFAIKSKNVARDHWMIAEHLKRTPEVVSHPEMYEAFCVKVQQNADDIIDSGKEMRPPSYEIWDAKPTDEAVWNEIIIPQWQYYWSGAPQSGNASGRVCVLPWYNSTLLKQWLSNSTDRKIALMYLWELPNAVADLDSGFPLTFHRGLGAMAYTVQKMPRVYEEVMSKYPNGTLYGRDVRFGFYNWLSDRQVWGLYNAIEQFAGDLSGNWTEILNDPNVMLQFNTINTYLTNNFPHWDLIQFNYGYGAMNFGGDIIKYDNLYLPIAMRAFGIPHSNRGIWYEHYIDAPARYAVILEDIVFGLPDAVLQPIKAGQYNETLIFPGNGVSCIGSPLYGIRKDMEYGQQNPVERSAKYMEAYLPLRGNKIYFFKFGQKG